MNAKTTARTITLVGTAIMIAAPATLVLGQQISRRVKMMRGRTTKAVKVPAFVNANSRITTA